MSDAADLPIRGQRRTRGFRRVSHGLFLVERELDSAAEWRRDLRAWLAVLPEGAVFTHLTAAALRGWHLPRLPEHLPVFAAVRGDGPRPRRPGLICSRLTHEAEETWIGSLPVDAPEEVLLRCARDLGTVDLTILVDSALACGDLDPARVDRLLSSGRPGVVALREAWRRADARAQSPGETLLRLLATSLGLEVTPQARLLDDQHRLVGVADLLVDGTTVLLEYDGAVHRDARQHRTDLRRERSWSTTAYRRLAFTLDDLLNHAPVVAHELDRALLRSHDLSRLARWRALVEGSLYSEAGRRRLVNRWHRQMGTRDWSRTT